VEQGVHRLFLPPAVLTQLARLAPEMSLPRPALREVITAGEALPVDEHVRALFLEMPACQLINQYGPTEAHVVTSYHLDGRPGEWPRSPPIGTPIAGVAAYVLSDRFRPVPAGVPGELHLGGVGLARGYLNRPGQTAERFVPDPFGGPPGGRLYRTGDLVRQRVDGNLEFLGRIDRQVKLRGFRIEMGEIEAVLTEHEAVAAAVVALRDDLPGGAGLAAYVVPSSTSISTPLVRAYLAQRLPSHMVPVALVTVAAIPLTRNGKIDYDALPSPLRGDLAQAQAPDPSPERERPRTPVERALAQCFSELLGLATVGVDENFFALGGHSLLATQLISRVRDRFHVELPLRQAFENPTVATLAVAVVGQQAVLSRNEGGEMPPRDGAMPPGQGDPAAANRWDRPAWRRIAIRRSRKPGHR
jgi:acyl carrier protein